MLCWLRAEAIAPHPLRSVRTHFPISLKPAPSWNASNLGQTMPVVRPSVLLRNGLCTRQFCEKHVGRILRAQHQRRRVKTNENVQRRRDDLKGRSRMSIPFPFQLSSEGVYIQQSPGVFNSPIREGDRRIPSPALSQLCYSTENSRIFFIFRLCRAHNHSRK